MLVPAITVKEEIYKKFNSMLYEDRMFYYNGYAACHELPAIENKDNYFQWASVVGNKVIGYIGYHVDPASNNVHNFGMISFEPGNPVFARDTKLLANNLLSKYHRLEWICISGNPVLKHYSRFCKEHKGHEVILHDTCKDDKGEYHDLHIFEIIKGLGFITIDKGSPNDPKCTYIK